MLAVAKRTSIRGLTTGIMICLSVLIYSKASLAEPNNLCYSTFKNTFNKIKLKKQKIELSLKYSFTHNVVKTGLFNGLGFIASGWPIWYFPDIQFLYRNSLSDSQKVELEKVIRNSRVERNYPDLQNKVKTIETWNRARLAWAVLIGTFSFGSFVDDVLPLENLANGKEGVLNHRVSQINEMYYKNSTQKLNKSELEHIKRRESEKDFSQLLIDIYKDNLTMKKRVAQNEI